MTLIRPRASKPAGRMPGFLDTTLLAGALLMAPLPLAAAETESSIARGGRLYDKWWTVVGAKEPRQPHPAYPAEGKYKAKGDWRCKECHGWDYLGKDGAYGKGKHFTGIKGIQGAANTSPDRIMGTLTNKTHALDTLLSGEDLRDLAMFVSKGQINMASYIDPASKKVKGNKAKGEPVFNTVCANCHGRDGTLDEDGKPLAADSEPLGLVASDNPWEALHKIRNGQPGEHMPALRALDLQLALDILAHMQTMPTKVAPGKQADNK
jgi:mono/diheme cytochrome c family protein